MNIRILFIDFPFTYVKILWKVMIYFKILEVKVLKNIDKYTWNDRFEPWIRTICLNTYKDKYRKSKRWLNIIKDYFNEEKKRERNN